MLRKPQYNLNSMDLPINTEIFTNIPAYILPFHEEINYHVEKKQEEMCISLQWQD